jgi:hypothetical protein
MVWKQTPPACRAYDVAVCKPSIYSKLKSSTITLLKAILLSTRKGILLLSVRVHVQRRERAVYGVVVLQREGFSIVVTARSG